MILEYPCAPGLHFSPTELKCMFPALADCDINYVCPEIDDERNPIVLPDRFDCTRYYICFRGSPIQRQCATGLWFDIRNNWCTTADAVECDSRTPNNPNVPTQPPPTTEQITTETQAPTDPPILDNCYQIRDLYHNETGEYLKSLCTFNRILSYEESEVTCRNHNMELFVINNETVEWAFQEATTESLSVHPNGFVWINGRRESTEEWFTFNPNRAPLFDGITWVQTETVDGRTSGDCLRYSSVHGPYQAMGVSCDATSYLTCEFQGL